MQHKLNGPAAERFTWERPTKEKLQFLKRKQEELESKRALKDFQRHLEEDENND